MAAEARWTIRHACGHQAGHEMSHRPAGERAGYARWLAGRDCPWCWKANREHGQAGTGTEPAGQRAAEQAEADAWSRRFRMPPLEGSTRSVPWAVRCRHRLVVDAYTALVIEGVLNEEQWEEIEARARTVTRAGWWIDQRFNNPAELPALLTTATDADRPVENPHF
jgi:hypothetical protein